MAVMVLMSCFFSLHQLKMGLFLSTLLEPAFFQKRAYYYRSFILTFYENRTFDCKEAKLPLEKSSDSLATSTHFNFVGL